MIEHFDISELFKRYIESLDDSLASVFKQICLGSYTLDEYCRIIKDCIEHNTSYSYTVLVWHTKTTYFHKSHAADLLATNKVSVNCISYPRGTVLRPSKFDTSNFLHYQADTLNIAYYHLSNKIDDDISTIVYSECNTGFERKHYYNLYDFFKNGGVVFILLPSSDQNKKSDECIQDYYIRKYGIDICDDTFINPFRKICNGWYKFFLKSIDAIPERKVLTVYKNISNDVYKNGRLCCRLDCNNATPVATKNVKMTMHYERSRS